MNKLSVCLAQTNIKFEDKEYNLKTAETLICKASGCGSDIIFFPEMSFTGFSMNTSLTREDDNYTFLKMVGFAKKYSICIGFGWTNKLDGLCENVYSILDKEGNLISRYSKIHPFSYSGEDKYFVGGNKIVSYHINNIPCSTFICYDLRFPEVFRLISDDVHFIILPACWPASRSEHWKTLLRARAIENQIYILAINCQGDINGMYYSGDSCIINPCGEIIDMISNEPGMITYDIDDDVCKYRNEFPVLRDKIAQSDLEVLAFHEGEVRL